MKRNRRFIAAGCLLLVLLLTGIFYLNSDGGEGAKVKGVWICGEGIRGIQSISITHNQEKQRISFSKTDGHWQGSDGSVYDDSQFAPYTAALGYMRAEEELTVQGDERQEYGLDDPAYTVGVTFASGKAYSYGLGDFVDGLGLYISVKPQGAACLIDSQRGKILQDMVSSLYYVSLTDVKFDEIRGISLFSEENGLLSMNRSEAPRADGDFYWNLFKPFGWTADTGKVQELIDTVRDIGKLERIQSPPSAEECGLDKEEGKQTAITFYDTYDSEMILYLGDTCGDSVYCRTSSLEDIYLIDKKILLLTQLHADELIDQALYYYEVPSVERCRIEWEGESHELRADWVADGQGANRGQRYYLDGEPITGADYQAIAAWFSDTKVTKVVHSSAAQGEILGVVTVERLSSPYEQTLTFCKIKGEEKLVQVDLGGTGTAFLEKEKVEELINLI